jgi:hypothetical protein
MANELVYHLIVILAFRPFLIVQSSLVSQRDGLIPNSQAATSLLAEKGWLLGACNRPVSSSLYMISFVSRVFESTPIIKVRAYLKSLLVSRV